LFKKGRDIIESCVWREKEARRILDAKGKVASHLKRRIHRMREDSRDVVGNPGESSKDVLTAILRRGARELLAEAVEAEVAAYIEEHQHDVDERGKRLVVRNGHKPEREILTGIGPVPVCAPRVNDRRTDEAGHRMRFSSSILPPYLRKARSVEELIPWLYLKGISTGDFGEALGALLGVDARGLSAATVTRLKEVWQSDYEGWSRRSLEGKRYVYFWVDGVHFNIRLEEDRQCILVVMGARPDGEKELVGLQDGYRESEQSWKELLLDLKGRGLEEGPRLAIGDGGLGFWKALPQVFGVTREQRCWVHKTANVLNKLPKGSQGRAKGMLHEIWMAETKAAAEAAFDRFLGTYEAKYPKATECLGKDRDALLTFYDFPAEHWAHIRTTNPIESTFATVRLRTVRTKGCGSRLACLTMVFKLAKCAEHHWRRLNASERLPEVIQGIPFIDGIREKAA
jgi:transposase-like protein